jgi:hypothetical protein
MEKLIGRVREVAELEQIYNSGKPELVVVYGRRRVGKTFLVRSVFAERMAFSHAALSPIEFEQAQLSQNQLLAFHTSLVNHGVTDDTLPGNWIEAFDRLRKYLVKRRMTHSGRQVVFIDELPWMDVKGSGFVTALEHFWNNWASAQPDVMLIVCGSATSWISDHLLNNYGGLYGRITAEFKLSPFSLRECEDYYHSHNIAMSRYDQVQCYMAMGGIPYYLSLLKPGLSLSQNLDNLFFSRNGRLRHEFDRLFNSLFSTPEPYVKVVKLLSGKREGYTRREIAEHTKIPYGGGLSQVLKGLEVSDFVQSYLRYQGSKREVHFRLTDHFVLFHSTFVSGHPEHSETFWSDNFLLPSLNAWRGFAFESICFTHIDAIKNALGVRSVNTTHSPWRSKGSKHWQIDLVIDRADRVVNLCEMKFSNKEYEITKQYDEELRNKVAAFIEETKCRMSVHPTLVTTFGLVKNIYSGFFQNVITIDDLFD